MKKKKTDVLFIHNNFPGQYKLVSKHLAQSPTFRVFAIGSQTAAEVENVTLQRYRIPALGSNGVHSFAARFDLECRRAEQIVYAANVLKLGGMSPRLIFVHPGWGESLPLRQIFPDAKICVYCEFFYRPDGADVGFDPESQPYGVDGHTRIHLRNAATLLALVDADIGIAPTAWQRDTFPEEFRSKIRVLHDGIDIATLTPGPSLFRHPALSKPLRTGDEVLTFVARNLEPYRGFHIFMRALPRILAARPNVRVCIVGGSGVSYGSPPPSADNWKNVLMAEVGGRLDMSRVHFLDRLPYDQLVALLRVSRVHTYLTYPFVLSWSLLEALALECVVVASDVAPVREVIKDKKNGLLVPFFDPDALAEKVVQALRAPEKFTSIKKQARETLRKSFCFEHKVLPQFLKLMSEFVPEMAQHTKWRGIDERPAGRSDAFKRSSKVNSHASR